MSVHRSGRERQSQVVPLPFLGGACSCHGGRSRECVAPVLRLQFTRLLEFGPLGVAPLGNGTTLIHIVETDYPGASLPGDSDRGASIGAQEYAAFDSHVGTYQSLQAASFNR